MALAGIAGAGLAVAGALHFVKPELFEEISKGPFPEDTDEWIKRNGATELTLGLLLMGDKTRPLGVIGLGAYAAFLSSRLKAATAA